MDPEKQILEYIRAQSENYTREAINNQLKKKGFSTEQIEAAWKTFYRQNVEKAARNSSSLRPNFLTQWSFWLTMILFMLGVPFISGLLDGISSSKNNTSELGFTGFSVVLGGITLLVAFIAGIVLTFSDRKAWQHAAGVALIFAPVLTLIFLFVPPFILFGVCMVGVRLGQGS